PPHRLGGRHRDRAGLAVAQPEWRHWADHDAPGGRQIREARCEVGCQDLVNIVGPADHGVTITPTPTSTRASVYWRRRDATVLGRTSPLRRPEPGRGGGVGGGRGKGGGRLRTRA